MAEAEISAERPTRFSRPFLICFLALVFLSFASGVILWRIQATQTADAPASGIRSIKPWLTLHGTLNPLLCAVFGYLLCLHVPVGWKMKANRRSGSLMLTLMALLILSGACLYYSGNESFRSFCVWLHRISGLLLPIGLAIHWVFAVRWARQRQT